MLPFLEFLADGGLLCLQLQPQADIVSIPTAVQFLLCEMNYWVGSHF